MSTMKPSEVEQIRSLVEAIAYRFRHKADRAGVDLRDLKQAAWLKAITSFQTWEAEKGALSTILWAPLHDAMARELAKLASPVSKAWGFRVDLSEIEPEQPIDKSPLSTIQSRELLRLILDATHGNTDLADLYLAFMLGEIGEVPAASQSGMTRRGWQSFVKSTTETIRKNGQETQRTRFRLD